MELFELKNLSFSYPNQESKAIDDINLTIEKGDFFVLCGPSGGGKSTLLRQLKSSIAPHGKLSGEILFYNKNIQKTEPEVIAEKIAFVMQSPESQTVTDKVWHELAFGLESLGYDNDVIRHRCAEMAAFFGIENWYYKNVSELSGGQKQLLCLASAMTLFPDVLILDEPTAQLDPIAATEFLSTLGKINRELGTTVVLSEHRLEDALSIANKAAVMDGGKILCCGTVNEIGAYLKTENSDMFKAMPTAMRVWGSVKTDEKCPITVNEGRAFLNAYHTEHTFNKLEKEKSENHHGEKRIKVTEAWFRYEKNLTDVIKNLSFEAYAGEMLCILGGNGAGKTTTLKLIGGLKKPYRGDIKCEGRIGFLPQDPQTIFLKKTVYEDLVDVLKIQKISKEQEEEEIKKVAALCEISELLDRHPYDLSGGEQQRAALAKVLLLSPDILLLDEPTKGLDVPFKETLSEIFKKLTNAGMCIIMVSHDIEFCASNADRCGMFFDGNLVTVSRPEDFFAGNNFYTTAANRMARDIEPRAITTEDVIKVIGGEVKERKQISEKAPSFVRVEEKIPKKEKLPLWRKIGAIASVVAAFAVFLYTAKTESLSNFIEAGKITENGIDQIVIYGILIALLVLAAIFIGKRPTSSLEQMTPKGKRQLSKRTIAASIMILLLIPITLFIGIAYLDKKQYYITALLVMIECMIPFFLIFEKRKPKPREIVIIATLCAMAIAGRAAFFMLPQFKPVMALTIIAGVAFGAESGFLVGAVTMLVSNILFSQGPWTPFQMFAMGIIGFLAGILYRKGLLRNSKASLCIFGGICTFIIYGGIMNPASALIWGSETLNLKIILTYYITGFPMDAVHAAATVLFLWFGAEPMLEKLERIKTKYGLIE